MEKEEKLVELESELECLFDVSSHLYHHRVEKERLTEIAAALEIPGEYDTQPTTVPRRGYLHVMIEATVSS